MILDLLIKKNKDKLENLIVNNADYKTILKQSQKLDKYITKKTIQITLGKHRKN